MRNLFFLILILNFFTIQCLNAKEDWKNRKIQVLPPVCYASDKSEKSFIPPPPEFLLKSGAQKKSDIRVTYSLFPAEAKTAFQYAVSIWESIIESEIPIYIEARWRTMDSNVLGSSAPSDYYSNFEFAPRKNRFYPVSVVEKITKTEISGSSSPDITATFNKDIKWYFGTDGKTPELLYDFVTVVLHEIAHGLGFTGFCFVTGKLGAYGNENAGDASAFDIMVMNDKNQLITDTTIFKMPSSDLYNAFTSDLLYSGSRAAAAVNAGRKPRLYAPATWNSGSSIYHLNETTYPATDENSLMTHVIAKAEAVHDPGPITKAILADVGWKHMKIKLEKPKDSETKKPFVFNLSIESDVTVDTTSVFLVYSEDAFKTRKDSLLFLPNKNLSNYSVTLNPNIESGRIDYYIKAGDVMQRVFFLPVEAPNELFSVTIGNDNIAPEIEHTPLRYFVSNGDDLKISVKAFDNLGIDTVFVEYSINNKPQTPFGLTRESKDIYSGIFPVDTKLLKDSDEIAYQITATDASKAKNKTTSPAVNEFYSFRVEKIYEPVGGYFNDFNLKSRDFVLADFDIYTAAGFKNGSLHSPHPYPSPNKTNTYLNFTTLLKYPIILTQNGTMSFDEVVLVEPGETLSKFGDDNFWDYVIVEGSKDNGKTWLPLINGYDSGENATWKTNYNKNVINQVSSTVGIPDWYINRQINLTANGNFKANDTILIQFRLFSDPFAHGWGWTIDNLRIQTPVSARLVSLSPGNISIYPNPFNNILNIEVKANYFTEDFSFDIFNVQGQKVYSLQNKNVQGEFKAETDLSYLQPGIYLVVVKENGIPVLSKKIIRN